MIGHREGVGHRLVPAAVSNELEAAWRAELRALDAEKLAHEPGLLRSLRVLKREATQDEPKFIVPIDTRVTHSLLLSGQSEVRRQTVGNRAVTRSPRLAWDVLIEI